jgi:hypothetical protein
LPEKFGPKTFDDSFISPISEQRLKDEPGPDVFNVPVLGPEDPLKLVPGGTKKGKITDTK